MQHPSILFFSHICSPQAITGAEKLLLLTMTELSSTTRCILAVPEEGMLAAKAREAGISVHVTGPVPIYFSLYQAHPGVLEEVEEGTRSEGMEQLYRLMITLKPSAVWVNTCVHPLPAIAAARLGLPVIWCLTETMRSSAGTAKVQELMNRHANLLVGISASTLTPIHDPGLLAKSAVLYPAVDSSGFQPWTWSARRAARRRELGIGDQQCLIGFMASHLYVNKGVEHFVAMASAVGAAYPESVFAVIGNPVDPPYFQKCVEAAAAYGLSGRFRWLPFEPDIINAYPAMDILVVPSIVEEGFGMTAVEGMMFRKPVVAYASGGLAEIMQATGNAEYLARPGQTLELANLVSQLTANTPLRQAVASRSEAAAHSVFGRPAYRARLEERIRQMKLTGGTAAVIVRSAGGEISELRNWELRTFVSPAAMEEAGYGGQSGAELPDSALAMLARGEHIGAAPPSEEPSQTAAPAAKSAPHRGRSGRRGRLQRRGRKLRRLRGSKARRGGRAARRISRRSAASRKRSPLRRGKRRR